MRWLARWQSILGRWRRPDAHERALDAELQTYLQADVDARIRAGDPPAEARRRALIDLGGIEAVKTDVRDHRAGAGIDTLAQDVRYALRTLRKHPASSGSVVGSVALGMTAMIVSFAFANAVLYRPTPGIKEPDRLIEIRVEYPERANGWSKLRLSQNGYRALAAGIEDLGPVAAFDQRIVGVTLPAALSLHATLVTGNYFDVFGARLAIGRPISVGETGRDADTAVLSYRLWTRELGADPSIVGHIIHVGGLPVQITGVAAEDFTGPWDDPENRPDLWLPLGIGQRLDAMTLWPNAWTRTSRLAGQLRLVARLQDAHELSHAQARAGALASLVEALEDHGGVALIWAAGDSKPASTRRVVITPLRERVRQFLAESVPLAMPIPIFVLVIACVNAANLLLARATDREREMAVRIAIGASRSRIVRQLLVESLVLSGAATIAAIPVVWSGLRMLEQQFLFPMQPNAGVVTATFATVLICAIGFGVGPALRAASGSPARGLRQSHAGDVTPRQSFTRRALVVGQLVVSLGLLGMGSQLIAATRLPSKDAGTPPNQLLLASFDLNQVNMPADQTERFYTEILARVSARPEVEAAGVTYRGASVFARHAPFGVDDGREYLGGHIAGDLFEARGLKVIAGRTFTSADRQGSRPRVAIVNEPFSTQVFKGQALGQILEVTPDGTDAATPVQIVGVVEGMAVETGHAVPSVYLPISLGPEPIRTLFAKSRTTAAALMPVVRQVVRDVDARVAFTKISSLADDHQSDPNMPLAMALAEAGTVLGVMALALAAWGLYALMSHSVATRSREFAVRMALGAETRQILRLVGWQAGWLAGIGGSLGTFVAVVIGLVIQANFQGTVAAGIGAHLMTTALLAAVMFAASVVPAARAARVSPLVLLKDG